MAIFSKNTRIHFFQTSCHFHLKKFEKKNFYLKKIRAATPSVGRVSSVRKRWLEMRGDSRRPGGITYGI